MSNRQIIKYTIAVITLVIVLALGIALQRFLSFANLSSEYSEHFNGSCQPIFGVRGGEDVTIDKNGIAWISATDRFSVIAGKKTRGKIMVLDLNQKQPKLKDATPASPPDFRPHGINLWTDKTGARFLFVVNHPSDGSHSILRYRINADGSLELNGLFQSPEIKSPNDVVAVGRQQFYYTNDLGTKPQSSLRIFEVILAIPWGSVGFFDGKRANIIVENISFANGINRSKDGKQIYVAQTGGHKISIFDRNQTTNALTLKNTIEIPSGVDNIELDQNGDLLVAAHPKPLAFGEHIEDHNKHTPSQVFQISLKEGTFKEIYYNHGAALDGAATAASYKKRLLLGPVFDDHLLLCDRR